jgi:chitinase
MYNSVSIFPNFKFPPLKIERARSDNNYCGVSSFTNPADWDFSAWDNWAKTQSVNKNVKVFIGAPAAPSAANSGSYVDVNTLGNIAVTTRNTYSSFGGIMLWDASVSGS